MTLLSRKLCTLLGSPRSPCWCRVRPLLLPRPLLTVRVTLLLFLGPSSLHNRPLLHPPPPGGGRLRTVRVRFPFRKPPATPVASKRGPGSGQHDVPAAPLRVGACLALHWRWWQAIGVESWVVSILSGRISRPVFGLSSSPRPLSGIVSDLLGGVSSGLLRSFRRSRRCWPKAHWRSFSIQDPASTVAFFWWKRRREVGVLVIDLSPLNGFVCQTPFKMETAASVLLSVQEGDFLAFVDLKDTHFQIPVHRSSRKLLRFTSEGTVYQFKVLCFGLSTAPPRSLPECLQPCQLGRTLAGFDFYDNWTTGWSLPPQRQWPGNTSGNCCRFVTLWGL